MGRPVLERIVSHFDFIKRTRLMDNGLYGKTTGLANGFDNTPNQDYGFKGTDVQRPEHPAGAVRLLHRQRSPMRSAIQRTGEERFQKEYEDLTALINEKLWSEEGQFYFNLDKDQQFTNVPHSRPACGRCPHTWRRRNAPTRWSGTMR